MPFHKRIRNVPRSSEVSERTFPCYSPPFNDGTLRTDSSLRIPKTVDDSSDPGNRLLMITREQAVNDNPGTDIKRRRRASAEKRRRASAERREKPLRIEPLLSLRAGYMPPPYLLLV